MSGPSLSRRQAPSSSNGRPTLGFQQFVTVEEAEAAKLRARAQAQFLAAHQASNNSDPPPPVDPLPPPQLLPGISMDPQAPMVAGCCRQHERDCGTSGMVIAIGARVPPLPPPVLPVPTALPPLFPSNLDWDLEEEDEQEWQDFSSAAGSSLDKSDKDWSRLSLDGSGGTAESGMGRSTSSNTSSVDLSGIHDPTVRLALVLGLDPYKLPMFGGHGSCARAPAAAIKALRSALARPIVSPCMEALLTRHTNSSHQRLTKSMLAKQRQTTGAADDQKIGTLMGQVGRVQTIDALLLAMTRRLGAVKAAIAADAALRKEQQQQQQLQAAALAAAAAAVAASGTKTTTAEAHTPGQAARPAVPLPAGLFQSAAFLPRSAGSTRSQLGLRGQQRASPLFARKLLVDAASSAIEAQQ